MAPEPRRRMEVAGGGFARDSTAAAMAAAGDIRSGGSSGWYRDRSSPLYGRGFCLTQLYRPGSAIGCDERGALNRSVRPMKG